MILKALNREYKSAYTQNNFFRNPFKEKNNNSLVLKVAKAYLLLAEKKIGPPHLKRNALNCLWQKGRTIQ